MEEKNMDIIYLIWDWSGVVSNDKIPNFKVFQIMFRILGMSDVGMDEIQREYVFPYMDFWHKYFPYLTKEEADRLYMENVGRVEKPTIYPLAKNTLAKLHEIGLEMIVLSIHPQKLLDREAEEYGIKGFFRELNGGIRDKIEVIREIVARNGFEPARTAYVGDTTHDVDAGKAAGVKTIAVTWGYYDRQRLQAAEPDYLIDDFPELLTIIGNR